MVFQIALASILHVVAKRGMTIDSYVSANLIPQEKLPLVIEAVKGIRHLVKRFKFKATAEQVSALEDKVEKCRNQENNIDSELWVYSTIFIILQFLNKNNSNYVYYKNSVKWERKVKFCFCFSRYRKPMDEEWVDDEDSFVSWKCKLISTYEVMYS